MKKRHDNLAKIEFTTGELRNLPPVHAGFLVSSCLAINEISIIQKVLLLALNTRATKRPISSEALQEIAYAQTIVVQRNLAAKVLEYLKMTDDYGTRCKRCRDISMQLFLEKAADVTSKLRDGEDYKLALWYRNTVTNHYLVSELTALMRNGDLGGDDNVHSIYLHHHDGNSSYVLGEQVLLAKLSEDGGFPVERIEKFENWVIAASAAAMKLHHAFCIQLFKSYLPAKNASSCHVTPEPHLVGMLTETCLPILWDFAALSASSKRVNRPHAS